MVLFTTLPRKGFSYFTQKNTSQHSTPGKDYNKLLLPGMKPICQTGSSQINIQVGLVGSFHFEVGP